MSKLVNLLPAVFINFCVATVLTLILGLVVLELRGYITGDKLIQIAAVMHGVSLAEPPTSHTSPTVEGSELSISLDEAVDRRSIMSMHLALREQALDTGLADIRGLRDSVETATRRFSEMREGALKELADLKTQATEKGLVEIRRNLDAMEAQQAKGQIVFMIENGKENGLQDVVSILSSMTAEKKEEIYAEFRTMEDMDFLAKIMATIRSGEPQKSHIETAQNRLSK